MNMQPKLVDRNSYIAAGATLIIGLVLFFSNTQEFLGSLAAAIMAAALVWVSWVLMRWLILALRK